MLSSHAQSVSQDRSDAGEKSPARGNTGLGSLWRLSSPETLSLTPDPSIPFRDELLMMLF